MEAAEARGWMDKGLGWAACPWATQRARLSRRDRQEAPGGWGGTHGGNLARGWQARELGQR